MLNSSWQEKLCLTLKRLRRNDTFPRVAIVGIGHELRSDDAAGVLAAYELQRAIGELQYVLVIPAGSAPENCCGSLRRFSPDFILLIDAAQMNLRPGQIQWIPWQATIGTCTSTHTLPLHIVAAYLSAELNCEVALLGIQPANIHIGESLSSEVEESILTIAHTVAEALKDKKCFQNNTISVETTSFIKTDEKR